MLSQLHVELSVSGPEAKQEITIFTFRPDEWHPPPSVNGRIPL